MEFESTVPVNTNFVKSKKILIRFSNIKKPENLHPQAFYFSCDLDGTEFEPFIGRFEDLKILSEV